MIKRILAILALGAALVACSPADGSIAPDGLESVAPIESMAPDASMEVSPSP